MKKIINYCLLLFVSLSWAQANVPSYIAIESNSGKVLYSQAAEQKRPISSLAQIATALVALDWIDRTGVNWEQIITVPQEAYAIANVGNPMQLRPGDRLTLRDALFSTLLGSDNVSALSVAAHVGRDLSYRRSGGAPVALFVKEMNNLAAGLGMKKTKFYAPHGMDAKGAVSESCAVDMALLGNYAMRNARFAFVVSHATRPINVDTLAQGVKGWNVKNTNAMLSDAGVEGIKTGNSQASGPCLLISAKRNAIPFKDPATGTSQIYPQQVIVVVLGDQNRYATARLLVKEGWRAWEAWFHAGMPRTDAKEFLYLPTSTGKTAQ